MLVQNDGHGWSHGVVGFLFSPNARLVLDIFRALGDFEDHYDVAALDALEEALATRLDRMAAKGLVSDALLLAFGLRRERSGPLELLPVGSRRGTLDEYRLHAMIAASYWHDHELAADAAECLALRQPKALLALAFDIARRFEGAELRLDAPSRSLLHADRMPAAPLETVEIDRRRPAAYAVDL